MVNCSNVNFKGKSDSVLQRARIECFKSNLKGLILHPKETILRPKVTEQEYAEAHKKASQALGAYFDAMQNIKNKGK